MNDCLPSGDLRGRAARQFRLAQIFEDVVNLSVRVDVMHMSDHAVKDGNHPESDLDSQK
jgi:hypothetical protein